eukprot:TRINITY_DN114075_c0_g1_i1.p1 TRINITY_DN114075_c0_g1~~TRINITY_DN114075_c0_g1_i1.p1  ORF type:complete len:205 (+),score=60.61 TRINITY_DN114075_c0_g1_i1:31-645(+)
MIGGAAIEASYSAQTEVGRLAEEEDLLNQALEMSRQEEERREARQQNQALREQQEMELQESILMDQLREQEEKRRRLEEEQILAESASIAAEHERQQQEKQRQQEELQAAKRARIPDEPGPDESDKVDILIRALDGSRTRRRFRSSDLLGQVYDFVDVHILSDEEDYRLVSSMPRKEYTDRNQSLADAALEGQCALMIERIQEG